MVVVVVVAVVVGGGGVRVVVVVSSLFYSYPLGLNELNLMNRSYGSYVRFGAKNATGHYLS